MKCCNFPPISLERNGKKLDYITQQFNLFSAGKLALSSENMICKEICFLNVFIFLLRKRLPDYDGDKSYQFERARAREAETVASFVMKNSSYVSFQVCFTVSESNRRQYGELVRAFPGRIYRNPNTYLMAEMFLKRT